MSANAPVRVAISADFLDAFSRIPRSQQAKVRRFIEKFKADPTAPGINFEKISNVRDPKLRSVRIDQAYRGIILKPESGNVYLLLWVDNHDDAYAWAENKMYSIHPETGALQVIDTEEVESGGQTADSGGREAGLFADFRDRELTRLGVPEELLPLVRGIVDEEDLERSQTRLPQEAFEALYMLAAGYTLDEVDRELAALRRSDDRRVDTEDYEAALENPDTRRRFHVVEDEVELAEILNAPLEKWRVFLHPSQRQLVEMNANGPVRVLGGAGTGKTVVAMHRAKYLVEHIFDRPEQKLLFTTFTRNLAADIQENLRKICPEDVLARIEVVNLDQWVSSFLRKQGHAFEIDYGARTQQLWQDALSLVPAGIDLPHGFYREEWEQVVQPLEVTTLDEYLRVPRIGRGTRLTRSQRQAVWPVFEEYLALLNEKRLREADGAMRDARLLLQRKGDILPYRSIVIDEGQDFGRQALLLIRAMVPAQPNDIFLVGDAHQRIYRHPVVLSQCGIDIRGRGRKLRINYRTTEQNRRWAVALLEGLSIDDLDGGVDTQKGYRSLLHGVEPEVHRFDSYAGEVEYIESYLRELDDADLRQTCLVARTNSLLEQYQGVLRAAGIETYVIRRSQAEDRAADGVRLATMHRVKGLEFDRVVIAGVNDGVVPLPLPLHDGTTPAERAAHESRERSLLYVAATRARREVKITCHGAPSKFL